MTSPSLNSRTPLIDSLKAIAAQLIVLHHLAFYGPLSDAVYEQSPLLIDWLYDYARMAVQIFIVVGGFLAARSLTPVGGSRPLLPIQQIVRRYMRLVPPYVGALLIAIVAATIARTLMQDDSIPAAPSIVQFLSHLLLLNDLLDQDALTTGAWYVAIDIQLFVMLTACVWLTQYLIPRARVQQDSPLESHQVAGRHALLLKIIVGVFALGSLLYFNRSAEWDDWGIYFFGAYALGVLAYWAANARSARWMLVPLAFGIVALVVELRLRIAVATLTALTLCVAHRYRHLVSHGASGASRRLIYNLGQSSYALFLVHFPVCLLVNAVVSSLAPGAYWPSLLGLIVAWGLSNVAGAFYCQHVERNMGMWWALLSTGSKRFIRTRRGNAVSVPTERDLKVGPLAVHYRPVTLGKKRAIRSAFNANQARS